MLRPGASGVFFGPGNAASSTKNSPGPIAHGLSSKPGSRHVVPRSRPPSWNRQVPASSTRFVFTPVSTVGAKFAAPGVPPTCVLTVQFSAGRLALLSRSMLQRSA